MKKVLIFPAPFLIESPTLDQQNDYMISMVTNEVRLMGTGDFVNVNALKKSDYCKEVRRIIAEQTPDWVIAAGESATACINLHRQRKILVNPIVTFDDLNNVPEYARRHTYGFFGAQKEQERSYELFQTVYPNASWRFTLSDLQFYDIRDIAIDIINDD